MKNFFYLLVAGSLASAAMAATLVHKAHAERGAGATAGTQAGARR